jgi:hypothetical protein
MNWFKTGCILSVVLLATGMTWAQTRHDENAGVSSVIEPVVKSHTIDLAAKAIASGGRAERGQSYSTGFEPPFTVGFLGTQQGWTTFPSESTTRPEITNTGTPYAGALHLRMRKNSSLDEGTAIGGATPLFSPGYESGEVCLTSVQLKITATGGADYTIDGADSVSGTITWLIDFDYSTARRIYVLDYSDPNAALYLRDTGATWTLNTYKEVKVVQTLGVGGFIDYYYGGTLIFRDTNGITGAATRMNQVELYSDNDQLSEAGYWDALSVQNPVTGACCLMSGNCEDTTPTLCALSLGTFEGFGTVCATFQCPQREGACCYADYTCAMTLQAACTGTWLGAFVLCTQCPQPPTGACCYPGYTCAITTQAACTGAWLGANVPCNQCPLPPTGACCYADYTCAVTTQAACTGTWLGADVPCDQCPPPPTGCVGDLNCDGSINFGDINPFVLHLSNFSAWQAAYPGCPATNGDINGDGTWSSFRDINPFVALLSTQPVPQCP